MGTWFSIGVLTDTTSGPRFRPSRGRLADRREFSEL